MRALARLVALVLAAAASTSLAARASPADALRPSGKGAAAGGAIWVGPKPAKPPRRVITLAPSLTDVVLSLGLEDRLVGVTRLDDAREVARLPRVGGFLDPNPEAILGLNPDLVLWVTDGGALPVVRRLAELSAASSRPFPILAIPIVSVADTFAAARLVGEALGEKGRGDALAGRMEAAVGRLRARSRDLPEQRVLFVVGREPLVVAGPGSFPDELLRIVGCRNVVTGARPWPVYPLEKAVADDPAIVVDAAAREPPEGIQRLSAIPAVRRGDVVRLPNDDLLRAGPRMIAGLETLFRALEARAPAPAAGAAR